MAKLPRSGVGYQCLYEGETTLTEVFATSGLKPLSKKADRELRFRLGLALALWDEPYADIQVKDVAAALNAHAKRLDKLGQLAAIARGGYCRGEDIAVSGQLVQALASNSRVGSVEAAHVYLSEFCDRAEEIARACRAGASSLRSTKGKCGRSPYHWHDAFTAVLVKLCELNKIEPSVGTNRISGEPIGGLFKVASKFEQLLPPRMRSRSPSALVKRLQRSLQRAQQRS